MKCLDKLALEEIENIAAEGDLDAETRLAHAAELVALRRLHQVATQRGGHLKFIRITGSLPAVADVAAWKKIVADSKAAVADEGDADLVSAARKS